MIVIVSYKMCRWWWALGLLSVAPPIFTGDFSLYVFFYIYHFFIFIMFFIFIVWDYSESLPPYSQVMSQKSIHSDYVSSLSLPAVPFISIIINLFSKSFSGFPRKVAYNSTQSLWPIGFTEGLVSSIKKNAFCRNVSRDSVFSVQSSFWPITHQNTKYSAEITIVSEDIHRQQISIDQQISLLINQLNNNFSLVWFHHHQVGQQIRFQTYPLVN